MTVQFLKHDGETLAWQHQAGNRPVGVVFLGGWCSDMNGSKAVFLADWCAHRGIPLTRLDYRAHGQSSGQLVDFTIGGALADVLAVLQETAQGPQVIVGSSMGGWLALLLATRHPQYV
ncbi:MAG: alpha/beta hydrolase, partial [Alphaproteobacteria bacterium]|nr:alpha/beta hydrolase [Alphaproteobacteria bacterium]